MRGPPGRHQQDLKWTSLQCRTGSDGWAGTSLEVTFVSSGCVCVLTKNKITKNNHYLCVIGMDVQSLLTIYSKDQIMENHQPLF